MAVSMQPAQEWAKTSLVVPAKDDDHAVALGRQVISTLDKPSVRFAYSFRYVVVVACGYDEAGSFREISIYEKLGISESGYVNGKAIALAVALPLNLDIAIHSS